ncbi:flagellar protein export ATPase FliI [Candidatus Aerophobetes bacterium]|uniref:Flagellar protein export ATPase FliI n=1 Tax=Aerophobetes bacterium TaxID=2030807 RepID=A0A497E2A0_UNCAE|nr:flagellar protein export ATPase FliI [Candidatus Aerophobetes bacterium]RLE07941.1 MAG: flagellar protein export ATPase FliI [Candidatus Aerophobetes bacterium]
MNNLSSYLETIEKVKPIKAEGRVTQAVGSVIESLGPTASIGEICQLYSQDGKSIRAEVVGFKDNKILLMPIEEIQGIRTGATTVATGHPLIIRVGEKLLGRVVDGLGQPIDGKGPLWTKEERPIYTCPPSPLSRRRIRQPLSVGIRAIDGLLTCGKGQRMGIFAGSGVGKSSLLGRMAKHSQADVNVIALIGERGREVQDFLKKSLGEEGLRRSVVVAVTSDQPALLRVKGAFIATTIAEYFRDQGLDVLLIMDSLTRFAMAQREIGLAIGEPPGTKAYPPSVYALLPRLLERAGCFAKGSITAFYAVLVEADDINEPISDAARSILDGHIVLSRNLASRNHYPAIDILRSISRLMVDLVAPEHKEAAHKLREVLSIYEEAEDLINIGAYVKGSNPKIDYALAMIDKVNDYLRQDLDEYTPYSEAVERLIRMFK